MAASLPPFYDEKPINSYRKIIKGQLRWVRTFSYEIRELIQAFLQVRPTKRLGMQRGGVELIRRTPFFDGFNWKKFRRQRMNASLQNKVRNITDMSNFEKVEVINDQAVPVGE